MVFLGSFEEDLLQVRRELVQLLFLDIWRA